MKKRLLFVDDEQNIRLTLPRILAMEGFEVEVAASVAEALQIIQSKQFDILISDLNIGEPGDGFTVVSAMRRIQPHASTFILTGYPDFETALLAIRNQVDDYLTKPADIPKLLEALRNASTGAKKHEPLPVKSVSAILLEQRDDVVERWYGAVAQHPALSRIRLARAERISPIPDLLLEIAARVEDPSLAGQEAFHAAEKYGEARYAQGYAIPDLLSEASILERVISDVLQEHLLVIDISSLIPGMREIVQTVNCAMEISVRSFLHKLEISSSQS